MGFLNAIITVLFIGFIAVLVIGFNRQMIQKNKEREKISRRKNE